LRSTEMRPLPTLPLPVKPVQKRAGSWPVDDQVALGVDPADQVVAQGRRDGAQVAQVLGRARPMLLSPTLNGLGNTRWRAARTAYWATALLWPAAPPPRPATSTGSPSIETSSTTRAPMWQTEARSLDRPPPSPFSPGPPRAAPCAP
jgi:hypothetical protein